MESDRVKRVIEAVNAELATPRAERRGSASQGTLDEDVSRLARDLGVEWRALFSPRAWAACAPRSEDAGHTRDDYAASVLRGMLAKVRSGRGGQEFKFHAAPMAPPARCQEVVFEAECSGEGDEACVRVTITGELAEVRDRR